MWRGYQENILTNQEANYTVHSKALSGNKTAPRMYKRSCHFSRTDITRFERYILL